MILGEIFEHGHQVALARNPARRVVRVGEAFHLVNPDSLTALVVRKAPVESDLLSPVTSDGASETNWVVDHIYCWCDRCAEGRRLSQTSCDD